MTVLKISKLQGFIWKSGWQKLFLSYRSFQLSAAVAIATFERLPNFNMLFQPVLTKFFKSELFSCLPKVDHVIKSYKEPILWRTESFLRGSHQTEL